ncbi:MAG: hypothetical protein FJX45_18300 [Alphaproteobacteria bacterium]|nr:hypothetical protein [Alphaproteobacteria bacterium]MBM3654506.1 hypothetical protein [Alphaproteobacteria bacterium]
MTPEIPNDAWLVATIRRYLPFPARLRKTAIAALGAESADTASRYKVTQLYCTGASQGVMCHLESERNGIKRVVLIASIMYLSVDGRLAFARDLAAYQKSRRRIGGGRGSGGAASASCKRLQRQARSTVA